MVAEPLADYFVVGARQLYLLSLRSGSPVDGQGFVKDVIDRLSEDLDRFQLFTTKTAARELLGIRIELNSKPPGYLLTDVDARRIADSASKLSNVLDAETKSSFRAVAIRAKRFPLDALLRDVGLLFAKNSFQSLPAICKYDIDEGAKCIAVDLPTAAAFHFLRGTEAFLRELYRLVIKRKRRKDPMWNDMVQGMRAKKSNRTNDALLDQLDSIRKHYRNPTQHPDKIYNLDEAQDLLSSIVPVIDMMVTEAAKFKPKT